MLFDASFGTRGDGLSLRSSLVGSCGAGGVLHLLCGWLAGRLPTFRATTTRRGLGMDGAGEAADRSFDADTVAFRRYAAASLSKAKRAPARASFLSIRLRNRE